MKDSTKTAIGYYLAFISLGLTLAALGPTLPGLAEQTRSTLGQISILFAARSLGFLVGSLLVGRLLDRLPGHRLMTLSLVLIASTMALVPVIGALWLLTTVMFFLGTLEPGIDVGGNTLLVWVYREKVGPYMNGLHFFFGVGAFLAPAVVAWALASGEGVRAAYWVLALLILLPAPYIARRPSPRPPAKPRAEETGPTRRPLVVLLVLFFFLYAGAELSFGGWIFSYAATLPSVAAETAAGMTSVFWIAFTTGRLLAVPISLRLPSRIIIPVDLIGAAASAGFILLWPQSVAVLWAGTVLFGLFLASVFPTALSLAERHLEVSGRTTSYFFAGASLGGMSVPWLIGQLFEPIGPVSAIAIILGCLVASLAVFGLVLGRAGEQRKVPSEHAGA